ncbi:MAG: hypothetical protein HY710_08920 [Candidatus Latescibacteria bacterium]|nr:hypothetical protein [Candidatus Latescibacterota bacterium]
MLKGVVLFCTAVIVFSAGSVSGQPFRPVQSLRLVQTPDSTTAVERPAGKSPGKAFLLSAIFPGAGQLYVGKKRGLALSALELGGITAYVLLNRTGNSRKRTVYAFADAHWDSTRCMPECTDNSVGEPLGPHGSQQYYEQIGKYEKFRRGWDDDDPALNGLSPNRRSYVAMRHDMNQAYKWATYSVSAVLVNHLVSAIDAALAARSGRGASGESRLRLQFDGDPLSLSSWATVWFTF